MTDTDRDGPLRQVARLRGELTIASTQLGTALFLDQSMLGVEFGVVSRYCLPDWIADDALRRPAAPERAIPVRQIAAALGDPPETTRRHIARLRALGAVEDLAHGVALAATPQNEARVARYCLGNHDLFLRLMVDLSRTSDARLPVAVEPTFGLADVLERVLDTMFLPIDTFHPGWGRVRFLLWGALLAASVRHITFDPVLARRYADVMPPDEVRRAVSLRRLAAAMSMPYATAWRHARWLEARGLISRVGGDAWAVLTRNLVAFDAAGGAPGANLATWRKLRELALLGLDPARASDHYRLGEPARADIPPTVPI